MLTTKPYLRTRRPSPTTAEFIVSTQPPLNLSMRILLGLVYLVRLLAGLGVLLILSSAWYLSPYSPQPTTSISDATNTNNTTTSTDPSGDTTSSPPSIPTPLLSLAALHRLLLALQTSTSLGRLATSLARAVPPLVLAPACLAALYSLLLRVHTEERLLVLRGLGIQTSSTGGATILGGATTRFIPTEKIRDVLVGEAFRGFEVRHYLAVVVDGEDDAVVVFPRLLPRPRVLEKVWRGVRGCLWEYGGGGGGGDGAGRRRRMMMMRKRGEKEGVADAWDHEVMARGLREERGGFIGGGI